MAPALWARSVHDTCRRVMSLHKAARCCRISARGGCTDHLSGELPYRHAVCGGSSGMEAWETTPPLLSQEAAAFPCHAFRSWNGACLLAAVGFIVEACWQWYGQHPRCFLARHSTAALAARLPALQGSRSSLALSTPWQQPSASSVHGDRVPLLFFAVLCTWGSPFYTLWEFPCNKKAKHMMADGRRARSASPLLPYPPRMDDSRTAPPRARSGRRRGRAHLQDPRRGTWCLRGGPTAAYDDQ